MFVVVFCDFYNIVLKGGEESCCLVSWFLSEAFPLRNMRQGGRGGHGGRGGGDNIHINNNSSSPKTGLFMHSDLIKTKQAKASFVSCATFNKVNLKKLFAHFSRVAGASIRTRNGWSRGKDTNP